VQWQDWNESDDVAFSNLKLIHTRHARHHKTVAPACRPPPPRRRRGRQLRLAARPPTRSDVVRHAKCKNAVDCCIWLNLNFFTKRHATRVIYRLTVQTLPDGLETQFTPPDTTQTALSCRVWRAVWTEHYCEYCVLLNDEDAENAESNPVSVQTIEKQVHLQNSGHASVTQCQDRPLKFRFF